MLTRVFVYGTLCQGQRYHHIIAPFAKQIQKAMVPGLLFDLPLGYPAMIEGNGSVSGELVDLHDVKKALSQLDDLEDYEEGGFNNEYERVVCKAVTQNGEEHDCYVYLYSPNRREWLAQNGTLVPSGNWQAFKR